jgi:hypothetical protein
MDVVLCIVDSSHEGARLFPTTLGKWVSGEEPDTLTRVGLPRIPLCGKCITTKAPLRLYFGFCETCESWGVLGSVSPCGEIFPSLL